MRTLAIVLGLAFAAVAIVSGSCLPARCRAFFRGSKPARRACTSSTVSPRPPPPSCFSPSRGTPGDPAGDARRGSAECDSHHRVSENPVADKPGPADQLINRKKQQRAVAQLDAVTHHTAPLRGLCATDLNTLRLLELCSRPCWKLGDSPQVKLIEFVGNCVYVRRQLFQIVDFGVHKTVANRFVGGRFHAENFAGIWVQHKGIVYVSVPTGSNALNFFADFIELGNQGRRSISECQKGK